MIIASHFNSLHELAPELYRAAASFIGVCRDKLGIQPAAADFADEFAALIDSLENLEKVGAGEMKCPEAGTAPESETP